MNEQESTAEIRVTPKACGIAFAAVTLLWLTFGGATLLVGELLTEPGKESLPNAGMLGDTFGATNALFSAIATAIVGFALVLQIGELRESTRLLRMQMEQLAMQREELELQRAEMKLTRAEHEKTAEALQQQVDLTTLTTLIQSKQSLAATYATIQYNQSEVSKELARYSAMTSKELHEDPHDRDASITRCARYAIQLQRLHGSVSGHCHRTGLLDRIKGRELQSEAEWQ